MCGSAQSGRTRDQDRKSLSKLVGKKSIGQTSTNAYLRPSAGFLLSRVSSIETRPILIAYLTRLAIS